MIERGTSPSGASTGESDVELITVVEVEPQGAAPPPEGPQRKPRPLARRVSRFARRSLFFRLHLLYFLCSALVLAAILLRVEGNNDKHTTTLTYANAFSSIMYACCAVVLVTVGFHSLTQSGKALHIVASLLGSLPLTIVLPIVLKYRWMRKHFRDDELKEPFDPHVPSKFMTPKMEMRALRTIGVVVCIFYAALFGVSFAGLALYARFSPGVHAELRSRGADSTFWAFFHAWGSALQTGFPFFIDGMKPFNRDTFICVFLFFIMALGNTALPFALRFIVWAMHHLTGRPVWKYLLVFPRACCTHMFAAMQTRVLGITWVAFLVLTFSCFVGMNHDYPALANHTAWQCTTLGLVETLDSRATGFPFVEPYDTHPAYQALLIFLITSAAYPFIYQSTKSIVSEVNEASTKYHETEEAPQNGGAQAQQQQAAPADPDDDDKERRSRWQLVVATAYEIKNTVLSDVALLILCIFLILVFEHNQTSSTAPDFVFRVMFEVCSSYGSVGVSMGFPTRHADGSTSYIGFARVFTWKSQIVLAGALLLGRMRGHPATLGDSLLLRIPERERREIRHRKQLRKAEEAKRRARKAFAIVQATQQQQQQGEAGRRRVPHVKDTHSSS
eukprot:m51a1_g14800 putative trk2p (617) ;mRNA; f:535233-537606